MNLSFGQIRTSLNPRGNTGDNIAVEVPVQNINYKNVGTVNEKCYGAIANITPTIFFYYLFSAYRTRGILETARPVPQDSALVCAPAYLFTA